LRLRGWKRSAESSWWWFPIDYETSATAAAYRRPRKLVMASTGPSEWNPGLAARVENWTGYSPDTPNLHSPLNTRPLSPASNPSTSQAKQAYNERVPLGT